MQMDRSCYQDLTVFGVYVIVDNDVTPLFGVVDCKSMPLVRRGLTR